MMKMGDPTLHTANKLTMLGWRSFCHTSAPVMAGRTFIMEASCRKSVALADDFSVFTATFISP